MKLPKLINILYLEGRFNASGITSSPLLVGKFDTSLVISCASTATFSAVTNTSGCTGPSSLPSTFTLGPIASRTLTTTVTTVSNAVNTNFCTALGFKQQSTERKIIVCPNPSSGSFDINLSNYQNESYLLEVFDLRGQNILSKQLAGEEKLTVNLRDRQKGFYVIKLTSGDSSFYQKVVVE